MKVISRWSKTVLVIMALFLVPSIGFAAIVPNCDPLPGKANSCGVDHLIGLLVNVYNYLLGFAAFVAMLFIVGGGMLMIYHTFDENPGGALESAKLTVRRAIFGLVIIACSYLLVNTLITLLGVSSSSAVGKALDGLF